MIGSRLSELRSQLQDLWAPPDSYLLDAGTSAELMIATVRLALTSVLLSVPLVNLLVSPPGERSSHLAGLALTDQLLQARREADEIRSAALETTARLTSEIERHIGQSDLASTS